jgi:thioredoxin reductase
MPRTELPRIAILGAGPVGLEAALQAATLELPFTVYERGRVGEHLQQWGHVRLFSPFGMNSTPLGRARLRADDPEHELPADNDLLTGRDHVAVYLQPLASSPLLQEHVRTQTRVVSIGRRGFLKEDNPGDAQRGRQPFLLLLRGGDGREWFEEADVVLDCTGTYGCHRFLGPGCMPAAGELAAADHIAYGVEDVLGERRKHYADKNVLVVGAGYSAATTVNNLATLAEKHPGTWVIWAARGAGTQPIRRLVNDPFRERDGLAVRANRLATRGDGNVEFHPQTIIESIVCVDAELGFEVSARQGSKALTWEVDRVIANVGYTPDTDIYRELQIHECYATLGPMKLANALRDPRSGDALAVAGRAAELGNPEPNFFILGAKSYGRNSDFLLRIGFEQVRAVFTLIAGRAAGVGPR